MPRNSGNFSKQMPATRIFVLPHGPPRHGQTSGSGDLVLKTIRFNIDQRGYSAPQSVDYFWRNYLWQNLLKQKMRLGPTRCLFFQKHLLHYGTFSELFLWSETRVASVSRDEVVQPRPDFASFFLLVLLLVASSTTSSSSSTS